MRNTNRLIIGFVFGAVLGVLVMAIVIEVNFKNYEEGHREGMMHSLNIFNVLNNDSE